MSLIFISSCSIIGNLVTITFLNVGKADAILIDANNTLTVIDTGTSDTSSILIDEINNLGYTKIDMLIITHFDKDHVGGAYDLVSNFNIDNIYMTYQVKENDETTLFLNAVKEKNVSNETLLENKTLTLGEIKYDIYAATNSYTKDESNNSSLAIMATYGQNKFFFAGDAEKQRIKELVKLDIKADLLKVPHHGTIEDNSNDLIKKVSPSISIITSSDTDLEDEELKQLLIDNNSSVYLTRNGTIKVTSDKVNINVNQ